MRKHFNKKRIVLLALLVIALAVGGTAAIAYWTAGGSGTGTATAGTTSALTAVQTTSLTAMYPGDTAQTISGNFNNPNSGPAWVSTVTASISSVTMILRRDRLHTRQRRGERERRDPGRQRQGRLDWPDDQVQRQGLQPGRLQARDRQPRVRDRITSLRKGATLKSVAPLPISVVGGERRQQGSQR